MGDPDCCFCGMRMDGDRPAETDWCCKKCWAQHGEVCARLQEHLTGIVRSYENELLVGVRALNLIAAASAPWGDKEACVTYHEEE